MIKTWTKKFAWLPKKIGVNPHDPKIWFKSYRERRNGSVVERYYNGQKYKVIVTGRD